MNKRINELEDHKKKLFALLEKHHIKADKALFLNEEWFLDLVLHILNYYNIYFLFFLNDIILLKLFFYN